MDRKTAVELAMKSNELEGFVYDDKQKALFEKVANNEISLEELKTILDKEVETIKINQ